MDGLANPGGPTVKTLEKKVGRRLAPFSPPTPEDVDHHHATLAHPLRGHLVSEPPALGLEGLEKMLKPLPAEQAAANQRTVEALLGAVDDGDLPDWAAKGIEEDPDSVPVWQDTLLRLNRRDPERATRTAWSILDRLEPDLAVNLLGGPPPEKPPLGVLREQADPTRPQFLNAKSETTETDRDPKPIGADAPSMDEHDRWYAPDGTPIPGPQRDPRVRDVNAAAASFPARQSERGTSPEGRGDTGTDQEEGHGIIKRLVTYARIAHSELANDVANLAKGLTEGWFNRGIVDTVNPDHEGPGDRLNQYLAEWAKEIEDNLPQEAKDVTADATVRMVTDLAQATVVGLFGGALGLYANSATQAYGAELSAAEAAGLPRKEARARALRAAGVNAFIGRVVGRAIKVMPDKYRGRFVEHLANGGLDVLANEVYEKVDEWVFGDARIAGEEAGGAISRSEQPSGLLPTEKSVEGEHTRRPRTQRLLGGGVRVYLDPDEVKDGGTR